MWYFLFLFLALGVAGLGYILRERSSFLSRVLVTTGCLGCTVLVVWQIRVNAFPPAEKAPDRAQAVVSYILGSQVLGQAGERHGTIVLIFPPDSVLSVKGAETYSSTFARVLRGFPGLKIQEARLETPRKLAEGGRVPPAAFEQAVAKGPGAVAYVSFTGVPADFEKLFTAGQQAPWFVFDPWGRTNWLGALKQGSIRSVIVPRPGVKASRGIAGEPSAIFNELYLMATPDNAEEIASQATANR